MKPLFSLTIGEEVLVTVTVAEVAGETVYIWRARDETGTEGDRVSAAEAGLAALDRQRKTAR